MELRDAIKFLRDELGVTQLELATALHVTSLTVSRWELGKSRPNRAVTSLLLGYAYTHNVKKSTTDMLRTTLSEKSRKNSKADVYAGIMAVEYSSLSECLDVFPFPVYVCDISTDILLYANKSALNLIGSSDDELAKHKCYKCIMHRDAPCDFCQKSHLTKDMFTPCDTTGDYDNAAFRIFGKLTRWNGHDAQIRIVTGSDM